MIPTCPIYIVHFMNDHGLVVIHERPINCSSIFWGFLVSSVLRKCSAITFIWDNCCHFTCSVPWGESTMTLIFVQLVAIFSVVKISTALTGDNGWSTDIPTETFTKIYFFNCTNPQEVMGNRAKPLLKQVEYISAMLISIVSWILFSGWTVHFSWAAVQNKYLL